MNTVMVIGIILLIAGFVLVGIEMVVPGFGAPGITGIICLVVGVFLTADTVEAGFSDRITDPVVRRWGLAYRDGMKVKMTDLAPFY